MSRYCRYTALSQSKDFVMNQYFQKNYGLRLLGMFYNMGRVNFLFIIDFFYPTKEPQCLFEMLHRPYQMLTSSLIPKSCSLERNKTSKKNRQQRQFIKKIHLISSDISQHGPAIVFINIHINPLNIHIGCYVHFCVYFTA